MKIAQVVSSFPPYSGGMGNVAWESSRRLAQDHEVHIFTPKYEDKQFSHNNSLQIHRITPSLALDRLPLIDNTAILFGLKSHLGDSFDLVHLHYPFFGTDLILSSWREDFTTPLVVTYHMDATARGVKGYIFSYYKKLFQDKVLDSADKVIVSTKDYVRHSSAQNFFSNNSDKFVELPFGADVERFNPKSVQAEQLNLEINPRENKMLFVGGMDQAHYFKGIPFLLQTMAKISDQLDFSLFLVGSGSNKEEYIELANKLGLSDVVQFLGHVPEEKLVDWYNFVDLTLLPSINKSEAFGLVLIESMACGTPVLASNLPGVREIAQKAGRVFEVNNKESLAQEILSFFNSEREISKKQIRQKIAEFNWNQRSKELEQIYSSLINNK